MHEKMGGINKRRKKGVIARRCSQSFFLFVFLFLFVKTDYNGTDQLDSGVNLLFRLDPFLAGCVMLGAKVVIALFVPALFVILLTLITGRGFCGWFCPMGSLLDIYNRLRPGKASSNTTYFPRVSSVLLVFLLVASLCGFGIAGYFDPFSILVRAMTQALYPVLNSITVEFFTFTYHQLPPFLNWFTEPVYAFLQKTILPSEQKLFQLAYLSLAILFLVFFLERWHRRFFCRNICPLGVMLGIFGKYSLLTPRSGDEECKACRICSKTCRMGAIDETREIDLFSCNLCYECVEKCPRQIIQFSFAKKQATQSRVFIGRRQFITAALAGLFLPSVKSIETLAQSPDPLLIRPPGAVAEKQFLSMCIRCGECLQVCIGNALQPALFQAGIDGMFSPVVVARNGYCEFNCTLCGQVCPTGAIEQLPVEEKRQRKIGHAWFDRNRCLPYAKATSCMVCEEHCPTPEKAIRFKDAEVENNDGQVIQIKQPYLVDKFCIGCGICETKCPLPGRAAIYVTSGGEHRHPEINSLPPASATNQIYY